jgi:hypothetical protein
VRSYAIPADDPSYAPLLNLSWTYDSAVTAAAFAQAGDIAEARQLLDQLSALQNTGGSIAFAFDLSTGTSVSLQRSGTIAWLGLASAAYDKATNTNTYLTTETLAANYLLSLQGSTGLISGGSAVQWVSTQHNLVAYAFLVRLGIELQRSGQPTAAAPYEAAAAQISAGIQSYLLVQDATGVWFREGLNDDLQSLDTQALGALYLQGLGQTALGQLVLNRAQSTFALTGRSIALSSNPATYNMTYSAPGPFTGYLPYAGPGAPQVLWFEGTAEMRMANAAYGESTTSLDQSMAQWEAITQAGGAGPLQADQTTRNTAYGVQYHVWPAAAPAAWVILSQSSPPLLGGPVPACTPPTYPSVIEADLPLLYYRFGEESGTSAIDSAADPTNGVYQGGVTHRAGGVTAACDGNTAVTLDGTSGYVSNARKWADPLVFTLEAWVKTTSSAGGVVVGFGDKATTDSNKSDRLLYMGTSGQVYFGIDPSHAIVSPKAYADGKWHLLDASLSAAGSSLYVDGALVASSAALTTPQKYDGYWRIGNQISTGWSGHPSNYFAGTVDEAAVYPTALTAVRIAAHYVAAP